MKRVLLCTIVRDARPHLDRWLSQIHRLAALVKHEYEVEVSVYENDSVDGSGAWLCNTAKTDAWGRLFPMHVVTETLGTQRYGSVWSLDRLRNLALARQRCLDQVPDGIARFDKVAYVEVDVTYDPEWCAELILACHPRAAGLGEPDIYSGWSLRSERNPKESVYLYDTCATRANREDTEWDITEDGGRWRAASLVPTNLGGNDANCLHRVWSTFNCFCVYDATLFKQGLKWGWVNHRLNTGQQWIEDGDYGSGWLDADPVTVCEAFRAHGRDKIFLNTNCLIRHS
jgi:hypothetical protein